MAHEEQPLEAMEVEYDSDDTDVIDLTREGESEADGDGEGSSSSSSSSTSSNGVLLDREEEVVVRTVARRSLRGLSSSLAAAAAAPAPPPPPLPPPPQYLGNNQSEEEDEESISSSSRTSRTSRTRRSRTSRSRISRSRTSRSRSRHPHNYLMDDLEDLPQFSSTEATQAPPIAPPQPSTSSSQVLDGPPPSPAPPPPVASDDSAGRLLQQQQQQEATPPFSSQPPHTRTSTGIPEGTGASASSSVAASVSNLDEVVSPPGVAGPSTASTPLTSTPRKILAEMHVGDESAGSEGEIDTCSICFEPWSKNGDHQLCCLTCGHPFGFKCISKWLQGTTKKNKGSCPQCKAEVCKKDIRIIYDNNILVQDTAEKEKIIKDLNKEREKRSRLEMEHAQTKLMCDLKSQQVGKLQEELESLNASVCRGEGVPPPTKDIKKVLVFRKWLELCRGGGCRVMAHNEWLGILVVSMPNQMGMFPGFGIKKINLLDLRVDRYVPLHQQQIRDLAFNPAKHDLLLSVGMDRMAKITNICSNTAVGHFIAPAPLWCCCWSTTENTVFYVGTAHGRLHKYDTRNTSGPIDTIVLPDVGPAVSMAYIQPGPESRPTWGSLVVAKLKACFLVEVGMPGEVEIHQLPLNGPFISVSYQAATCHVLVSSRPSQQHPCVRHAVCLLQQVTAGPGEARPGRQTVTAQPVHTFQGGTSHTILSRSLLAQPPFPDSSPLVYASDESTQSIYVWELGSQNFLQHLRNSGTVVDLLQVRLREAAHLVALTEKGVRIYRWSTQELY